MVSHYIFSSGCKAARGERPRDGAPSGTRKEGSLNMQAAYSKQQRTSQQPKNTRDELKDIAVGLISIWGTPMYAGEVAGRSPNPLSNSCLAAKFPPIHLAVLKYLQSRSELPTENMIIGGLEASSVVTTQSANLQATSILTGPINSSEHPHVLI